MIEKLQSLIDENKKHCSKGDVASYIPELSKANPNHLGVAIVDLDGKYYGAGDYMQKFTIQSISKTVVLMLALMDNGEKRVFSKVGVEPTGDPFNSLIRLETYNEHIPLNPMINAGAITITSLVKGDSFEDKFNRILDLFKKLTKNDNLAINENVYHSEKRTGDRNRSMGYFLRDVGNIEGDVEEILDLYFKQCSIEVSCQDIAQIGAILANQGVDLKTGEEIIPKRYTQIVKSLMVTCGMYDESGEFAINVGLPGKSGVGGGIMCVVPNRMGIGVFGPALDKKGNSKAGVKLVTELSAQMDLGIF